MSTLIDSMKDGVNLVDHTVDPLFLISFCARTCYASHNKDCNRERFIAGIIKSGHESVLENAYVTFYLKNISRVCQNQIVRHRIGCSYCVESQRYVKMHANAFKMPYKAFSLTEGTLDMVKDCFAFYERLIANGVPKEDARMFLPMGTTCNMTVTMNFRALRHFLKLRLSKRAQWEVRQIALEMYEICREKWPWLVEDIKYLED